MTEAIFGWNLLYVFVPSANTKGAEFMYCAAASHPRVIKLFWRSSVVLLSSSKVSISCFLLFVTVNEASLGSGLLFGQKNQPEDVTKGFRNTFISVIKSAIE